MKVANKLRTATFFPNFFKSNWNLVAAFVIVATLYQFVGTAFHFSQTQEFHLKYADISEIFMVVLAAIACPIKIWLVVTGSRKKILKRLHFYLSLSRICFFIGAPLVVYGRWKTWGFSKISWNTVLGFLSLCSILAVVIWVYWMLIPKFIREFEEEIKALNILRDQIILYVHQPISLPGEQENATRKGNQYTVVPVDNDEKPKESELEDYFISSSNVALDKKTILGRGQASAVYRGRLLHHNIYHLVAAKTINPEMYSGNVLDPLVEEISIARHVGEHKNIVQFFGVCYDLDKRYFLLTEFCQRGNLQHHLMSMQSTVNRYSDSVTNDGSNCQYENLDGDSASQLLENYWSELIRLSIEICSGMAYLASKKIVHGDLAVRNILLSGDLTAKLSDFGMSNKMMEYQVYTRNMKHDLMPWRWMSFEAIEELKFSEKSDVWAYGVTLWEIFSLGEIPFSDTNWRQTITSELRQGTLALQKPTFCSDVIYDVMLSCWMAKPEGRPTFADLLHVIPSLRNNYC